MSNAILERAVHEDVDDESLDNTERLRLFIHHRDEARRLREQLVRDNLRLVGHVAKRVRRSPALDDEVESSGQLGLLKALERYDPEGGRTFAGYAVLYIWTSMMDAMAKVYAKRFERPSGVKFTNAPDYREPRPPVEAIRREEAMRLQAAVTSLNEKDRDVLTRRYGLDGSDPLSPVEMGKRLGVTHQAISLRHQRAVNNLREQLQGGASR